MNTWVGVLDGITQGVLDGVIQGVRWCNTHGIRVIKFLDQTLNQHQVHP